MPNVVNTLKVMGLFETSAFILVSIVISHIIYKYLRRWKVLSNDIFVLKGKVNQIQHIVYDIDFMIWIN